MKTSQLLRSLAPLACCTLLLPAAASAQTTSFTATGWVNQVLAPGIVAADALGQVSLHGVVHTARVQSPDPRVTGQAFIIGDGTFNADGTANVQGPVYLQVGTWDAAGTNFTPSGAFWNMTWSGVLETNNSMVLNIAGYGVGAAIDGLRAETTLTRGPAAGPIDPAVPYLYAGAIKPAPVSTNLFASGFTTNGPLRSSWGFDNWYGGTINLYATNQQLYTRANWNGYGPAPMANGVHCYPLSGPWRLADGQTLEAQVDLVCMADAGTNYARIVAGGSGGLYGFSLGRLGVGLDKWTAGMAGVNTFFWWTNLPTPLPRTNVVLYLALTRGKANLLITTRVLDKANQNAVLFERAFVDTPGVDPALTTAQLAALGGPTTVVAVPDSGSPIFASTGWKTGNGGGAIGLFQTAAANGANPPVEALWDNFSLRLQDGPPLNIAPTVQLAWPAPAGANYSLEGAPTVNGPWLPVPDLTLPGIQKQTVPLTGPAQFFRLIQAP